MIKASLNLWLLVVILTLMNYLSELILVWLLVFVISQDVALVDFCIELYQFALLILMMIYQVKVLLTWY